MLEMIENWALHAYADGELDALERASVEALLADNAEARQLVDGIARQKAALHRAYDGILTEPVPLTLLGAASGTLQRERQWPKLAMAASLAMLLIGSGGGWFAGRQSAALMAESLPDRALDAHTVYATDFKHPVEVAATDSAHLKNWLSKRIGVNFSIPDLSPQGFTLVGGRLLAEADKPAGLLVYEDATKQRLSIYVVANVQKDESPLHVQYRGKLMSCYWTEHDLAYAVVGELQANVMIPIAEAAHEGFDS